MSEHGHVHWSELATRSPQQARRFYEQALGWRFEAMPGPDGEYLVAHAGETPVAGIFEMKGEMFAGIPEHWFTYIAVDDVDARVAAAERLGAKLHRPIFDIPQVGRIAILQEPTGAMVGWMTPAPRG
jgi:predicted enzyme related to lactoylglutathione lyase